MVSKMKIGVRGVVVAGLAVAALTGAGVGLMRSDLLLTRGFDRALESPRSNLSFERTHARGQPSSTTAGDEGYWLTRSDVESPMPFGKSLAAGDRITITGQDGRERRLEVVDLKAIGENPTQAAVASLHLMLVTCRVTAETAGDKETLVRFIIEADNNNSVRSLPAPAKAL